MSSSAPEPKPITVQRAWARLTTNMGGTNMQRARDARKAANALKTIRGRG